ncbi:hypothetical protein HZS_1713, partial [Henneguya salminicola]
MRVKIMEESSNYKSRNFINGHKKPVTALAYWDTKNIVATASSDCIKLYDLIKKYHIMSIKGSNTNVNCLNFFHSDNNSYIISASEDGRLRVWSLNNGKLGRDKSINIYNGYGFLHLSTILLFEDIECFSILLEHWRSQLTEGDSPIICTFGVSGSLKFWSYSPTVCLKSIDLFRQNSSSTKLLQRSLIKVMYPIRNCQLLLSTYLGEILYLDLQTFSVKKQVASNLNQVFQLKQVGDRIIVASDSENVRILRPNSYECDQILQYHQGFIESFIEDTVVCLDYRDGILTTGSKDDTICCWKQNNDGMFKCVSIGIGHVSCVTAVALSYSTKSDRFVLSASDDNTIKLWRLINTDISEVNNLMTLWSETAHTKTINSLSISPKNKYIISTSSDKLAKVWSKKGKLLATLTGHKRSVNCASFSSVDKLLATGSSDFTIRLWSLTDFTCVKTLECSDSSICCLSFLSNGHQIVAGYSCGLIKIWSIPENTVLSNLDGHTEKVWTVSISENSNDFVSADSNGSIMFWKDITQHAKSQLQQEDTDLIEKEQLLGNYIQKNEFSKAIIIAIELGFKVKLYHLIEDILKIENGESTLENIIISLSQIQLENLLSYVSVWNRNSKYYYISQKITRIIVSKFHLTTICNIAKINEYLASLIPYTERHLRRIEKYTEDREIMPLRHGVFREKRLVWRLGGESRTLSLILAVVPTSGSEDGSRSPSRKRPV